MPGSARVQGHFAPVRADADNTLLEALNCQRLFSLLDELDPLLSEPPFTRRAAKPAADVLPAAGEAMAARSDGNWA